eukprot:CAMPEP_0170175780 /NCGR_PEP_ID=MMETSP0040_2-20121228/8793_1 /TAXON_ID=641309 /ORGANISM="Lotharella oceanica, Strain CCMP622" /LENGTH=328 /DNA_ID=CAMNT_0010417883 /DNA_START=51 /DNA_END=1040 /DNA_ORIENTATION=-
MATTKASTPQQQQQQQQQQRQRRIGVNLVFLDIDGVLNSMKRGGLMDDLLGRLRAVVERTGGVQKTRIVLSSTWRYKAHTVIALNKEFAKHRIVPSEKPQEQSQEQQQQPQEQKQQQREDEEEAKEGKPEDPTTGGGKAILSITPRIGGVRRAYEILTWLEYNAEGYALPALVKHGYYAKQEEEGVRLSLDKKTKLPFGESNRWRLNTKIMVKNFVVLDDMPVAKHPYGQPLASRCVRTDIKTGISPDDVERAVSILNAKPIAILAEPTTPSRRTLPASCGGGDEQGSNQVVVVDEAWHKAVASVREAHANPDASAFEPPATRKCAMM